MTDLSKSIDHLDEETQKYIRDLRTENAKWRTEKNEVSTKYAEAGSLLAEANTKLTEFDKFKTEHEKFLAENATLQDKFNRVSALTQAFKVDTGDADRLKGSTFEELKADADTFAARVGAVKPTTVVDPAAGGAPNEPTVDPITAAFNAALGEA